MSAAPDPRVYTPGPEAGAAARINTAARAATPECIDTAARAAPDDAVVAMLRKVLFTTHSDHKTKLHSFRFDPVLMAEAQRRVGKGRVTELLEELLLVWLKRERRKDEQAKRQAPT